MVLEFVGFRDFVKTLYIFLYYCKSSVLSTVGAAGCVILGMT